MTFSQWSKIMRKADCSISYTPNIMDSTKPIAYIARCKTTTLPVGFWYAEYNAGSISVNGRMIITCEFSE